MIAVGAFWLRNKIAIGAFYGASIYALSCSSIVAKSMSTKAIPLNAAVMVCPHSPLHPSAIHTHVRVDYHYGYNRLHQGDLL